MSAALAVCAAAVIMTADALLAWSNGWPLFDEWLFGLVSTTVFGALGGLIVWKRPANRLGWLLLATNLASAAGSLAFQYGIAGTLRPAGLPGSNVIGAVGFGVHAGLRFGILITLFLLLFPDGRLPSRRWRPVAWTAALGIVLMVAGAAMADVRVVISQISTPSGFVGQGWGRLVNNLGHVLVFAVFPLAVASLFLRRRRAGPVLRRQLKWFAYGAVLFVASLVVPLPEPAGFLFETAATIFLPVSVAIAITRYRLYEIDRIVSRTVTYAVVTSVLAAVYVLIAVVPSTAFQLESDLLVAAATLAAAAAFVPVRRRVQAVVDRRFNRSRYDAVQVVEGFGGRLRGDLDLDRVSADIRGVVGATVLPAHMSLWIRSAERVR
ncbi:MAG TPA: hypothetical protein VK891_10700 [Euzebyales bacterium]|nr:hypothetical protein [Euzebyales bacterium]